MFFSLLRPIIRIWDGMRMLQKTFNCVVQKTLEQTERWWTFELLCKSLCLQLPIHIEHEPDLEMMDKEKLAGTGADSWNFRPFSKILTAQCCSPQRHDQIVSMTLGSSASYVARSPIQKTESRKPLTRFDQYQYICVLTVYQPKPNLQVSTWCASINENQTWKTCHTKRARLNVSKCIVRHCKAVCHLSRWLTMAHYILLLKSISTHMYNIYIYICYLSIIYIYIYIYIL